MPKKSFAATTRRSARKVAAPERDDPRQGRLPLQEGQSTQGGIRVRAEYRTPEYTCWGHMRQRCENPKCKYYEYYGGRGIRVCSRWRNYDNFLNDLGRRPTPAHTIERINNDGNYEPGNCRWATRTEQLNNTRKNVRIELNGETHTLAEWKRLLKLPRGRLEARLKRGWTIDKALGEPAVRNNKYAERIAKFRCANRVA